MPQPTPKSQPNAARGAAESADLSINTINAEARHHASLTAPATAWDTPGPAATDFRSDTITTPTASMLKSIAATTLLDDVFVEDPTTNDLQSFICELTGHEASLLVTSGTQGNQLALRAHLNSAPPHSIVLDARSHIYDWEAGGMAWLSQALPRTVHPTNGKHMTLEDVEAAAVTHDDFHAAPTKLVCLENTLGGNRLPLDEIKRISAWCKEKGIPLHCDGARLWEAVAADTSDTPDTPDSGPGRGGAALSALLTARLREYAQYFDTMSLCFSKGLGAPVGSILTGPAPLMKRARHARKVMGGQMRQAGIIAAPARVSVEETFLSGRLAASHRNAKEVGRLWEEVARGRLQAGMGVETNMVWCALGSVGLSVEDFVRTCKDEGLRVLGGRLVVHYQINQDAIDRWQRVCQKIGSGKAGEHTTGETDARGEGREAKRMKIDEETCP